jgi:hypothetical protein
LRDSGILIACNDANPGNFKPPLEKNSEVFRMPQAYCVRCKKKVEIKDPQKVRLKNGKPATKGLCPNCSTSVFRIGA